VAIFPATTVDSLAARRESHRRDAWARHPKPRSRLHEGESASDAKSLPHAPGLQKPSDRCGSKAPTDADAERSSAPQWPKLARDGRPMSSVSEFVHAAIACDEPAATAKSRFRRSGPSALVAALLFFYLRPLLVQPAMHFGFVLLAGLESRLLRRNVPFGQPLIEITRMECDRPLTLNHPRHAGCGPQFGGKSKALRGLHEPSQYLTLLSPGQLPRATAGIASGQCRVATATIGFHPAAHRTGMNSQKVGDGPLFVARQHMVDPQSPPPFQFFLETLSPHTYLYACPTLSVHGIA
jgi:hypothetical protein